MIESDKTSDNTTTPKRGYWAGFKDIGQFGRMFWVFVGLIFAWSVVYELLQAIQIQGVLESLSDTTKTIIRMGFYGCLIFFGSVFDCLGIRRMLYYLFGGTFLFLSLICMFWLVSGQVHPLAWMIFLQVLSLVTILLVVFEYQSFKRYTTRVMRVQAVIIYNLSAFVMSFVLIGVMEIVNQVSGQMFLPSHFVFPVSLGILICCLIVTRKYFKDDERIYNNTEVEQTILRPSSFFGNFVEMSKNTRVHKAFLLTVFMMLAKLSTIGQYVIWDFSAKLKAGGFELFFYMDSLPFGVSLVVIIVLFPIIGRINAKRMLMTCAVTISVALILLALPLSGTAMIGITVSSLVVLEISILLFEIRVLEYVLNAASIGREGSMVAVLGIVWLINEPFKKGIVWLLKSQKNADWTYTFTQVINADASNAHALWLIVLVPVALGTLLLFVFNRYLFDEVA